VPSTAATWPGARPGGLEKESPGLARVAPRGAGGMVARGKGEYLGAQAGFRF